MLILDMKKHFKKVIRNSFTHRVFFGKNSFSDPWVNFFLNSFTLELKSA
jgi:hypothetical protein